MCSRYANDVHYKLNYIVLHIQVIMDNHKCSLEYSLGNLTPAYEAYRKAHDRLVDQKIATRNEALQGIYVKARGYLARLAMILHALEQAIQSNSSGEEEETLVWDTQVTESSVLAAEAIIQHLNTQKEIMMGIHPGECIIICAYT